MAILFSNVIKDWDDSIEHWLKNGKSLTGPMAPFRSFVKLGNLSDDYIPEPYYGDPDRCSAVVININPGSSTDNEYVKDWRNRSNPNCPLIWDLENTFSGKYSLFQEKYSPFTAESWVPGVQWWKDNRVAFIDKVVSQYNKAKGKAVNGERSPLAMEMCPLHSKDTKGLNLGKKEFRSHYINYVFRPAEEAVQSSLLPFGLGFASFIEKIMNKCGYKKTLLHWEDGVDLLNSRRAIPQWPTSDGKPKKRTYKLISNGEKGAFLFTWDRSGSIIKHNATRMREYEDVDDQMILAIAAIF